MTTSRRAEAHNATTISRLIGALLNELRGTTSASRPAPGPELAARLLAMSDRIFGFLAFYGERPVGVMMLSEGAALYAYGHSASSPSSPSSRTAARAASHMNSSRRQPGSAAGSAGASSRCRCYGGCPSGAELVGCGCEAANHQPGAPDGRS
jgi:hypothetical protein